MQGWQAQTLVSILACACVACPALGLGGGPSQGAGGSPGSGGSRPVSDVPACQALFEDACNHSTYEYYLELCENENSGALSDILDCAVPDCLSPLDDSTGECIQLAVEDEQSEDVASLMYDVESICGSQLDNEQVRVVYVHAAVINDDERLIALAACLSSVYCPQIADCLTDPEVAPWWDD